MRERSVLLALAGGGTAWTLHLLAGYFVVSLGCARGWPALGSMLAGITGACTAGALAVTLAAWRARGRIRHAREDSEASRLLLGVGVLLGLLFTILIALGGLTVAALPPCQR